MVHPSRKPRQRNRLRIIGGQWRGRKFDFPDVAGLRPTPDRVRETVFNWLQPMIAGARCLDLFAGSGAFALEAMSRGARHAVMVDSNHKVIQQLAAIVQELGIEHADIVESDCQTYLQSTAMPCDVVFLDPPYGKQLLSVCCKALDSDGWLATGAYVYLEHASDEDLPELPAGWQVIRSKQAGHVSYHLIQRQA